jgi:two-component sensor histidine kinase
VSVAGGVTTTGWLERYRAWRGRSISNQITVAAVTIALAVAAVFGVTAYAIVRVLVTRAISAGLEAQAQLVEQKLLLDVDLTTRDLEDLAANSFVANGLVDSAGRDTYLLPFLHEHKVPISAAAGLVLCDFRGIPIAADVDVAMALLGEALGPRKVLATSRPFAEVLDQRDGVRIVVSYPVIFPPTGQVEGVMVVLLDVPRLLEAATVFLAPGVAAELTVSRRVVLGPRGAPRLHAGVTRQLDLPGPLSGIPMAVRLAREDPGTPLRWIGVAFLAIAAATVLTVLLAANAMARRLTSPIQGLSRAAEQVSVGGSLVITEGLGRSDEVGTLATALDAMLAKLRASHEELEERVRELRRREEELERYSRTQAVLLREVNHRVKNNLSTIIGLLHVEERGATARRAEPVAGVLRDLERRIRSLDTVHSLLSGIEWRLLPLDSLCQRLLRSILGSSGGVEPSLRIETSGVLVDSGQAHALALVLTELATNSLKYGRSEDGQVEVDVEIAAVGSDVALTYRDRGCGFPPAAAALEPTSIGTGLQLVRGITETNLGGSLRLLNDRGAVVIVRFPGASEHGAAP